MSIVLKDGTVLPDIPADVKDQYSDIVILYSRTMIGYPSEATTYMLVAGNEDFVHYNEATGEEAGDYIRFPAECVSYACAVDDLSEWSLGATSPNPVMCPLGNTIVVQEFNLLWSNHDIRTATTVDVDTLEYTLGTAIYFKSSIFRLPDGTELPALPEGCFEKYPYGAVMAQKMDGVFLGAFLVATAGELSFVPISVSGREINDVTASAAGCIAYELNETNTEWVVDSESDAIAFSYPVLELGEMEGAETLEVYVGWSNHDILNAISMNADGSFVDGKELYHKSDVNYRVYGGWMNSMGNQARRLGGVSGALKPGEMETVFSGATLEPLTVTPTSEEQTFTPESPCIGFSVVTVEAAPDTGGGDIVEPEEELTSAEDVTFDFSVADELCITNTKMSGTDTNQWQPGWYGIRFKASTNFYVKSLRIYPKSGGIQDCELALWDYSTGTKLASVTVNKTSTGLEWLEYGITPTQLSNGSLYVVAVHPKGNYVNLRTMLASDCTLKNVSALTPVTSSTDSCPTTVVDKLPALSMTIGTAPDPTRQTEYKIQYSSLEQLANEVERITGATGVTNIGQCIELLKSVPATT